MSDEVEYRTMTDPTHAAAVCDMMRALYAEDAAASGDLPRSFRRTVDHFLAHPDRGRVVLAVAGGAVAGYAVLVPYWSNEFGGPLLFVDELYVRPEARGRGVGRGLLERVAAERPYDAVATGLEVSAANTRARRLYESLGFRERTNHTLVRLLPAEPNREAVRPNRPRAALAVRPVAPADTPALVALADATGIFRPGEAEGLLGGVLEDLHAGRLAEGHLAWVWADGPTGGPVGWAYFSPADHADGVWNLWWIGVEPARQGHGAGGAMLAAVEAHVRAAGGRLLLIETSALPAFGAVRRFYAKRGYAEGGRVPDYYADGDGKVTYYKRVAADGAA